MSRRRIVAAGLAVLTMGIVVSLLSMWRWRACYQVAELTAANEVVTEVFGDEETNPDHHGTPNEAQVSRWVEQLSLRYPEQSDSWAGVEEARRDAKYRIWSAPLEPRIFESREKQRFCSHTLDLRYPRKSLHAECRSEDDRFEIFCVLSDVPAIRRLTFRDRDEPLKGSMEFYEIGYWKTLIDFEKVHYRLVASVDDFHENDAAVAGLMPHELNLAKHSARFVSEEAFLKTSLETLDELEGRIRKLLNSDDSSLSGFRSVPNVDLIRCTCEFEYPPAGRRLNDDEKAIVLKDAMVELDRRRDLLKAHSKVWFEMLTKVLID